MSKKQAEALDSIASYAAKYPPSGQQGKRHGHAIVGAIPIAEFNLHERHIRKLMRSDAKNFCKPSEKLIIRYRGPKPKKPNSRYASRPMTTKRDDATSVAIYVGGRPGRFDQNGNWKTNAEYNRDRNYELSAENYRLKTEITRLKGEVNRIQDLLDASARETAQRNGTINRLEDALEAAMARDREATTEINDLKLSYTKLHATLEAERLEYQNLNDLYHKQREGGSFPRVDERIVEMKDSSSIKREVFIKIVGEPNDGSIGEAVKILVHGGSEVQLIQKYTKC